MRGTLLHNTSLADYTSWRVGGPAKQLFKPADLADLSDFLKQLPTTEPLLWLGLGSNTLIRDKGFAGTVIITQGCLQELTLADKTLVHAQAGVACATMARFCARHNLQRGEFLAGIPGTVGGALRMNAGCFDGETWQLVQKVEVIDRQGNIKQREAAEYQFSYRQVTPPKNDEWFVAATFQLMAGDKQTALATIRQLLDRRAATQPTGEHSCGSVFRNPHNDYAARLIESAGLKGTKIGGAQVSEKHANFIINDGTATAQEIETLIEKVAHQVHHQHGVLLQPEVHIVGDK